MSKLVKVLIAICLGVLIFMNIQTAAEKGLKISQLAPHFKLKRLDGKGVIASKDTFPEHELTVLIFWDTYCPECLDFVAECQKFYEKADSLGVAVLSINFDRENIAAVRAFVKGAKITFPVLMDSRATVATLYQADPYDFSVFIIDKKGIIRYVCYEIPLKIYDNPSLIVKFITDQIEKLSKPKVPGKSPKPKPENKLKPSILHRRSIISEAIIIKRRPPTFSRLYDPYGRYIISITMTLSLKDTSDFRLEVSHQRSYNFITKGDLQLLVGHTTCMGGTLLVLP